jgi:hypothetical protein
MSYSISLLNIEVAQIVSDPLGNKIVIPQTVLDFGRDIIQCDEVMDDIGKVIEKPIMIFRENEDHIQLYYLRAIGWNRTMLIRVQKNSNGFEVIDYEIDPSIERITELHSKFERLI